MGMTSRTPISESIEELKMARLRATNKWHLKRLDCLILLKEGKVGSLEDVAALAGASPSALDKWLRTYREKGLDALLAKPVRNRSSKVITPEIHQGLDARLNDPENPFLGYWDAQQWIAREYGVKVGYGWLWKYMTTKMGARLKVPRRSNVKKETGAEEAFLKTP